MMSAERRIETQSGSATEPEAPLEGFALRQQVAERLAAHRSRRPRNAEPVSDEGENPRAKASKIAAAVAERYAQSKSYRAYLAEEAERAVREAEEAARQAEAAAEIAARNAEALAQVQYDLLHELDQHAEPASTPVVRSRIAPANQRAQAFDDRTEQLEFEAPAVPPVPPVYTVRHVEDLRFRDHEAPANPSRRARAEEGLEEPVDPSESLFLDEEIAFRQAPVFDPVEAPVEIPGNLIEFPRQLIAPRKARPRLAEGPLREEAEVHADPSQLRIFEVEAEQISPEPVSESSAPEWTSILLDAQPRAEAAVGYTAHYSHETAAKYSSEYFVPATEPYAAQHLQLSPETQHLYATPLQAAPLSLRVMSAAVDTCIVLAGFLVFAGAAVLTTSHFTAGGIHMAISTAAISAGGSIAVLGLLYLLLFFTFSESTPGMRYARIGLCTFSDENPSRAAMRRRVLALALSSASLGLGVLWALLDDERLGWHDRISRMYQRSY
ncbi:RDD family protein [Edaphobacter sp. HDX4]|uniref:RDD family protein n=1 Tax=Edaphobacter sp. HDX4 TaxID=2794064 RepID=UPI002FE5F92D